MEEVALINYYFLINTNALTVLLSRSNRLSNLLIFNIWINPLNASYITILYAKQCQNFNFKIRRDNKKNPLIAESMSRKRMGAFLRLNHEKR